MNFTTAAARKLAAEATAMRAAAERYEGDAMMVKSFLTGAVYYEKMAALRDTVSFEKSEMVKGRWVIRRDGVRIGWLDKFTGEREFRLHRTIPGQSKGENFNTFKTREDAVEFLLDRHDADRHFENAKLAHEEHQAEMAEIDALIARVDAALSR